MSLLAESRAVHSPQATAAMNVKPSAPRPSRHQLRDQLIADALALRLKWKTLITPATSTWPKVPAEDLLRTEGDFHRLAGLVQLRQQLDREESDRQVRDFLNTHYAVA